MGRRAAKKMKKKPTGASAGAGAGVGVDRISTLPLELRARIVSLLPYWQVIQLSELSRSWRYLHHHAPVVDLNLEGFVIHKEAGLLDVKPLVGLRVALARREREREGGNGSKVETLKLTYGARNPSMRRHADRLITLADATNIRILLPYGGRSVFDGGDLDDSKTPWKVAVNLPHAARDLELDALDFVTPVISGPGAAVLRELYLQGVTFGELPRLPSLRYLTLNTITTTTPFAPGASCPLLEDLTMFNATIEHPRVDILLPHLKCLDMDHVDINPSSESDPMYCRPFAVFTVDAPELEHLMVSWTAGYSVEYKSFALRAPRLRCLSWVGQFAERVSIDVGRTGCVSNGVIEFTSNDARGQVYHREMKYYRAQMMRMLEGLLPGHPPERVAEVARPHITVETYTMEGDDEDDDEDDDGATSTITEEKLVCDLNGVMSSQDIGSRRCVNGQKETTGDKEVDQPMGLEHSARPIRKRKPNQKVIGNDWIV